MFSKAALTSASNVFVTQLEASAAQVASIASSQKLLLGLAPLPFFMDSLSLLCAGWSPWRYNQS
jgi:hypothetical protein